MADKPQTKTATTQTTAQATNTTISTSSSGTDAAVTKNDIAEYGLTEKAGLYVASKRVGSAKTIKLTEKQAETPLRNGEIKKLK